jgi:hypothetical protein
MTKRILSDNAKVFLKLNPVLLGNVAGHWFYEHPTKGDESPLVVITPNGEKRLSGFWEVPSMEDLLLA